MRRAVHGLLSVALLSGMSLALAAALASVAGSALDAQSRDARCEIWHAGITKMSDSAAYASVRAAGLGSAGLESASAQFRDGAGELRSLAMSESGGTWAAGALLPASVSAGDWYAVTVRASSPDGEAVCSRPVRAG